MTIIVRMYEDFSNNAWIRDFFAIFALSGCQFSDD